MLTEIHGAFAWFVIGANVIAGIWAVGAHWLEPMRTRLLWVVTAIAQLSIFVEVLLGVILLGDSDDTALDQFHAFYGFVAIATVGIIYSYRSQLAAYRYLLYGGGGLFLTGLALRSLQFRPRS